MLMTIYKSDQLINSIEKELGIKFSAKNRSAMQKIIRGYMITVHKEAVEKTIIAKNKHNYVEPNFND